MEPNATSLVIKALKDMRCLCLCPSHGAAHGTSWNCSRKKGASPRPTLAQHGIILRRVDAEHVVSKGKKTKNIKHSGNLTKNVFLDLLTTTVLQTSLHVNLDLGGRRFTTKLSWEDICRQMRYKSLAKEFKGTAKEPVGLRCSFPCPSNGHAQGSVAGSTGDLGNMLRSRLHRGRSEADRPAGGLQTASSCIGRSPRPPCCGGHRQRGVGAAD